ncbi:MAG: phosphoenolpyruvate--protein phosphotransferase [Sedimentisphaerales bacterium]|nr:phosphoenolpyruvate--protein phosphotransferase [Sedimentisphaerales bacterium]
MRIMEGTQACEGIAIGRAIVLDSEDYMIPRRTIALDMIDTEIRRVRGAFKAAAKELAQMEGRHAQVGELEMREIFAVHRRFLQDPTLLKRVIKLLRIEQITAEYAVTAVLEEARQHLVSVPDRYISGRAADIADIERRLVRHLVRGKVLTLQDLKEDTILVARELSPSQIASFDRQYIKGIVCDTGGKTSHASIVARSMRIPAVVGLGESAAVIHRGDLMIVDGKQGRILIEPDLSTVEMYQRKQQTLTRLQDRLRNFRDLPVVTRDDVHIELMANIEFPEEGEEVLETGADGIGLFRTEFLYLRTQTEPTEEDHYRAYQQILETMRDKPVVVRTMDLGADRFTQSRRFAREANPFLGLRSIRFSLRHLDMFEIQLRAILRASSTGNVRIMLPLVTNTKEVLQVRCIIHNVMEDLEENNIPYRKNIPIGIMIETPAAALTASVLAQHVDVLSIGSNDLIQYVLAVDRGNAEVSSLYNAAEPSVLAMLQMIFESASRFQLPISICGEMASEMKFIPFLLGLGFRNLSMTPASIPEAKEIIRSLRLCDCIMTAQAIMKMETEEEIRNYLLERMYKVQPLALSGQETLGFDMEDSTAIAV